MKKILGLVASKRKLVNGEIFLKEAANSIEACEYNGILYIILLQRKIETI
ncbi:hypothetical protein DSBG_1853 [Desulfosporosinus sp. BG]|nr:hypothetical protein DSBG_1853 [Desulfosporosinus sp. BG]